MKTRTVLLMFVLIAACVLGPGGSVNAEESTPNCNGGITYTVQKGDTLLGISRRKGALVSCWNVKDPDKIYPGQKITCCPKTGKVQRTNKQNRVGTFFCGEVTYYSGEEVVTTGPWMKWTGGLVSTFQTWYGYPKYGKYTGDYYAPSRKEWYQGISQECDLQILQHWYYYADVSGKPDKQDAWVTVYVKSWKVKPAPR